MGKASKFFLWNPICAFLRALLSFTLCRITLLFLFCVNYRVIKLLSGLVHYRKPVVNLPSAIFGNGFENATELDELITSAPPLPLSMNASQSGRDSRQKTFSSSLYLSLIPRKGKTVLEWFLIHRICGTEKWWMKKPSCHTNLYVSLGRSFC